MQLVIISKLRWYHRLWHTILTLLGKECYAWEMARYDHRPYALYLGHTWLCPGCRQYVSFDKGCAHEDPDLAMMCDDCFIKRRT